MTRAIDRLRRRPALGNHSESGFTIVELVIAMMIFAIAIGGVVAGMSTSLNLTRQNRQRSVAANLASQEMDTIRSTNFEDLPLGTTVTTQTVGTVAYTVTRTTQYVTQSGSSGNCGIASGSKLQYLAIGLAITWVNMQGVAPVTSATVLAPPAGTGNIEVQIYDAGGSTGVSNVSVTVTDSSNTVKTSTTSSSGCAFFSNLSPDAYTVAISRSGYVDMQGSVNPSQNITVYADGIYSAAFSYDQAASVTVTTAASSGATLPAGVANAPITLGNTSLLPTGTLVVTGSANPLAISNLFPYVSGYSAWVGSCADAQPTSGITTVSVSPGGASSGTVTLPKVTVKTQTTTGGNRSNVAITATHASDAGCAGGESYSLGNTNSSGQLVVSLPYGLWTLTATLSGTSHTSCTGGTNGSPCRATLGSTMQTVTFKW